MLTWTCLFRVYKPQGSHYLCFIITHILLSYTNKEHNFECMVICLVSIESLSKYFMFCARKYTYFAVFISKFRRCDRINIFPLFKEYLNTGVLANSNVTSMSALTCIHVRLRTYFI